MKERVIINDQVDPYLQFREDLSCRKNNVLRRNADGLLSGRKSRATVSPPGAWHSRFPYHDSY